jgi:acyl-CoA thioesterase II
VTFPQFSFSDLLQLEPVGVDSFVAPSPPRGNERLFGGQVVAQAAWAALSTIDNDWPLHSLHAYFLRAGAEGEPVLLSVDRSRDGRSYISRRVNVAQRGGVILTLDAQAHRPEPGGAVWELPSSSWTDPPPDTLDGNDQWDHLSNKLVARANPTEANLRCWLKMIERLPDDPRIHQIAVAYMSDRVPLHAVSIAVERDGVEVMDASLDHAMWFHAPVRADDWLRMSAQTLAIGDNRGLAVGQVRTVDDRLVASFAQEGVVRIKQATGP